VPPPSLVGFLLRGFRGYSVRLAKSLVKAAIGREPHFYAEDRFFLAYLRHRLGVSRAGITCRLDDCPTEGGGSQALMMMIVIDFARTLGLDYFHSPFIAIQHADRPQETWLAAWEGLFNFGYGEVQADAADREIFAATASNFDSVRSLFGELRARTDHDTHMIPQFSATSIGEFRRKYRANKTPRPKGRLTVCVHLRRFNRFDDNVDYVASFSRVARTLGEVRTVLDATGIEHAVHLFSQGHFSELPDTLRNGVELHLDSDPIRSLEELVDADVLITSRGSFSYVAGLLCDGIVICEPFYPPQSNWLVCDDDGAIDTGSLTNRLT